MGMTTLLFIDVEAIEKAKKEREIDTIFKTIVHNAHKIMDAEVSSLLVVDRHKEVLWARVSSKCGGEVITVPLGKVSHCP